MFERCNQQLLDIYCYVVVESDLWNDFTALCTQNWPYICQRFSFYVDPWPHCIHCCPCWTCLCFVALHWHIIVYSCRSNLSGVRSPGVKDHTCTKGKCTKGNCVKGINTSIQDFFVPFVVWKLWFDICGCVLIVIKALRINSGISFLQVLLVFVWSVKYV